jgi:hypothetical protein
MAKKKYSSDFRQVGQAALGGAMALDMTSLLSTPGGAIDKVPNMVGFAVLGTTSGVAFNAIDGIYKSGKKRRRR